MAEDFGQSAKPTAAIRNILDTYPFSIGILREILQNSDDAGATRQVFASDSRTHPTTHLLSDQLSGAQGHALLAYNNTVFLENEQTNDWEALQNINESSKRTDTSKIGKYGIGFRSCYHITDVPQIMSGRYLAVFDPHHTFSKHGGKRVDLTQDPIKYSDHVHAMDLDVLDSSFTSGDVLNGTVIRLPLRQPGHNSEISGKTLTAMEIRQLFLDFIQDELGIALLFLRHLKSITFLEVDNHGTRCIGQAEFGKTPIGSPNGTTTQEIVSVDKLEPGRLTWRVVHVDFADSECANILERRLSRNVSEDLQREKLSPAVSLAFPMPLQPPSRSLLFTYLPLPLPTGFPCHIHSLFALTPSRQNLRNAVEQGLVHGARDELLVEWNKVLFEHFIPRAWGASLELLAHSCSNPLDLWQAWPPASQDTPGGDPFYWRQLVLNLTRVLIDEDRPIWPLIGSNAFARASHVLAASHDDQQYLSSLVTSGVQITLPPLYVLHTMDLLGSQERKLTPKSARKILMMNVARVQRTSSLEKDSLTRFLLSEGDPAMLAGLPIIPFMNGDYIALQPNAQAGGTLHALLDDEAASVFEVGSGNFIPISRVPANFITTSPAVLNVTTLGCAQVIGYLEVIVNQLDPSSLTAWLPQFWAWLTASSLRDQLCDVLSTSNLRILPDTKRDLHILKTIFFDTGEIDDRIQAVLSKFGLRFLDPSFPPKAAEFLKQRTILRSSTNIDTLLNHLQSRYLPNLSDNEALHLAQHITRCLKQCFSFHRLPDVQRICLCNLPLFPLLASSTGITSFRSLPSWSQIAVFDTRSSHILKQDTGILLPYISNMTFVAQHHAGLDSTTIVSFAETSYSSPLAEADIIVLGIEHLEAQSRTFQAVFLERMAAHHYHIPPRTISMLSTRPFVCVQSGHSKAPQDVVDPEANVATLFSVGDSRLPRNLDAIDRSIMSSLRSLRVIRSLLSDDIIKELLLAILHSPSLKRQSASQLLLQLNTTNYDCSSLQLELAVCWLPTEGGLRRPADCRDSRLDRSLFDRVLDVVDTRVIVQVTSPTLRKALGWDTPIPLNVVTMQLSAVVRARSSSLFSQISIILAELGRRLDELSPETYEAISRVVDAQSWIPTADGRTCMSIHALLGDEKPPPGFHKVSSRLLLQDGVREVLSRLGCSISASNASLLEELHSLGYLPLSHDELLKAIQLLKALDPSTLLESARSRLIVPNVDAELRPLHQIYFDNLGIRAVEVKLPKDRRKVNGAVKSNLATKLGVHTLSSLELERVTLDDGDMFEDLTTRISDVLKQYTEGQAFNEFLANAADAGAKQFDLALDKRQYPTSGLMSDEMVPFQTCPALIVYNNSTFSDEDWIGIKSVGVGGKRSRSEAIGKFGLGSLTMFHFSEVSMIVSGATVLFLDPSKKYLPSFGNSIKRAIQVPILYMRLHYPNHLLPLQGMHGFDMYKEFYSGTIFRLPLRTSAQAVNSRLSRRTFDAEATLMLLSTYGLSAAHSLLNVPVNSMTCSVWGLDGRQTRWSVEVIRSSAAQLGPEGTTSTQISWDSKFSGTSDPRLSETWHAVTGTISLQSLPEKFQSESFAATHRLRNLSTIMLAARIPSELHKSSRRDETGHSRCRLYSRLPLPTFTSLPVNIDAPFILAPDRRSIRFDEGGNSNLESQYNLWLLSERVPQLYTAFLQSWPTRENKDVWPGNGDREDSDPISRAVITGFYGDHFASSSRPFCDTMSGDRRIAPSEAEFVCSEPSGVKTIIFLLKPPTYVYPSARIRTRLPDDIRRVNAVSLRKLIISNAFVLRGLYRSKAFTADDVGDIFSRMIEESVDSVVGVNILPLMDGTLGTVEKGSVVTLFMREWLDDEEPWKIFPAGRFLLPAMHAFCDKLFDLNLDLNIRAFDEEQIVTLIRDVIPSAAVSTLSREQQGWLASLWRRFSSLGAVMGSRLSDSDSFKTLPLVPTLKPATFVSLQYCASSDDVLASPDRDHNYLERILDQVPGVHLIPVSTCPSWLQPHLASFGCSFEDVVRLFERKGVSSFTGHAIDKADHDKFAEYAREHVHSLRVPHNVMEGTGRNKRTVISYIDHLGVALQLPIWKARCNGQTMLVSASRYGSMLPLAVSLEVVNPFLEPSGTYMDYNLQLNTIFDIQPITVSALCSSLRFPSILEFSQVQLVKRLVSALITCGVDDGTTVYLDLPNTTRVPKKSNTLYAHFVPVFRSTFASSPELFLHPQLRDLENRLGAFGLNCAVTMQTFTECARFVHEELKGTGQEEHDGALDLYNFYSTELWRDEAVSESWNLLDDYRFVPRSRIRRNYPDGLDHPFFDHACPLPNIVSPGQILRPELEAIAWTQRALFEVAPSDQLLIAYPSLGVPRAEEVVEHLRTLRMIADRYKCNTNLIDDLLATYQWLNAHVAECRAHLREYAGEELFLNVDNPHITWRFAAGNQLIFNGRNEGMRQCVRSSMLPFKALILAAGAREIVDAVRPVLELSPAEEVLLSDRNTFNQYRLERKLTDVTLVSSDGQRFPAHRLILSTQSVWFESRFSPRWPANDTVGCSDVNGDILRYVLDFMYTRKNPFEDVSAEDLFDLQDTLLDLLKISHLWSISGLFELVENQLIGTISIDTCDELLKEAEMFPEATSLQEACAAYKANNLT